MKMIETGGLGAGLKMALFYFTALPSMAASALLICIRWRTQVWLRHLCGGKATS